MTQKTVRPDVAAAILAKPTSSPACPVTPHNGSLLAISYEERNGNQRPFFSVIIVAIILNCLLVQTEEA
ncbi:MAG: hypothetical protein HIU83_09190 [Proteobacteria bacterium]|nr:hypothetical protein [Pseudomonadota bacterium]